MAQVKIVNKQVKLELDEIIRFQLITYCYINNVSLSELDLDCLTTLGKMGTSELTDFCNIMADKRLEEKMKTHKVKGKPLEASPQTIRNALIKIGKENLLLKEGKGRKRISIHPSLNIQTEGNILLNYKIVRLDT